MALAKDKGRIGKYGGGVLWLLPITADGTVGDEVSADWLNLGYIETTDIDDTTETEGIVDETGKQVIELEGDRMVKKIFTLMQSDKETIDFLKETCRGQYYSAYWYGGTIDGFHQEWVCGICQVKPAVKLVSGVRRPPLEINVLINESAINYDASGTGGSNAELPTGSYATGVAAVTVPVEELYSITNTAV